VFFWVLLLKREEKRCGSINIENFLPKQGIKEIRVNKNNEVCSCQGAG